MDKFREKPAEAAWIGCYLTFADMGRAIKFYEDGLGMTLGNILEGPDGVPMHVEFHYKETVFLMGTVEGAMGNPLKAPVTSQQPMPFNFYLYCDDIDETYAKAVAAGAKVVEEPADQFWGDRTAMIVDTEGYSWMLASNVGDFDPTKIPAVPD